MNYPHPPEDPKQPEEIQVQCPRCTKAEIRHGKKIVQHKVIQLMNPGMILYHCPVCSFECRPYDAKLNAEQINTPIVPIEIGIVQEMMKNK